MSEEDLKQFAKIMAFLGELYGKSLSENIIEVYWQTLKVFSNDQVKPPIRIYSYRRRGQFHAQASRYN